MTEEICAKSTEMNEPNKLLEAMSCSADNTSPVVSMIIFSAQTRCTSVSRLHKLRARRNSARDDRTNATSVSTRPPAAAHQSSLTPPLPMQPPRVPIHTVLEARC